MGLGGYSRTLLRQGQQQAKGATPRGAKPGLCCGQNVLVPSLLPLSVSYPISVKAWLVLRGLEAFSVQKGSAEQNAELEGGLEAALGMF